MTQLCQWMQQSDNINTAIEGYIHNYSEDCAIKDIPAIQRLIDKKQDEWIEDAPINASGDSVINCELSKYTQADIDNIMCKHKGVKFVRPALNVDGLIPLSQLLDDEVLFAPGIIFRKTEDK